MSTSLQTSLFYPEKLASAENILAKARQKRAYLHRQINSSSTTTMHKSKKLKTQSHTETRKTQKNGDENISVNESMALKHSSHQNTKCEDHCDIRFSFEDININDTSLEMKSNQEDIKSKFKMSCNDEYGHNIHDPTEYLSEYEQKVQQNIAERLQFLTSLNIEDAKDDLLKLQSIKSNRNTTIAASKKYLRKPKSSAPVRRSLRLQEKPILLQCDTEFNPESLSKTEHVLESRQKPKVGKPLVRYLDKDDCPLEPDQAWLHAAAFSNTGTESCWTDLAENILERVGALQLKEACVTKVVPQRIMSMAMHPTNDTDLILAADKQGYLGLWSVDNNDLLTLKVHAAHINRLSVHSNNMGCVLTSSYDGSVRATHLDANTVTELYSMPEDTAWLTWHAQQSSDTLLISSTEGTLAQVDMRSPGNQATLHALSSKSLKVVTVHPKETHYFATVDSSGKTCLWDNRHVKRYNPPVCSFEHMRSCSGLTFSPVTGKYLLSTCCDDTLRLLNVNNFSSITNERTKKHNNKTGRWLTTLKADFLPDREDLIVVGSLNINRVIEVWHNNMNKCHQLTGDLLQTFCSTVCCHPTRPVIAGGNSSGKCHVFK